MLQRSSENLVEGELWFRAKVVELEPLTVFLLDEGVLEEVKSLLPYAHHSTGGGDSLDFPPALVGKMKLPECTLLCKIYCERPLEGQRYSDEQAAEFQNLLPLKQEFTLRPQSEHQVRHLSLKISSVLDLNDQIFIFHFSTEKCLKSTLICAKRVASTNSALSRKFRKK